MQRKVGAGAKVFNGEYEHTLDEKGRIFLPARYREALGLVVMVGRGLDGQVNVYPKTLWESMTQRVEQAAQAGEDQTPVRQAKRFLFSSTECELDRQGRIVVPPLLRRYANLDTEVVILGNNDRVEIWNRERWQQISQQTMEQSQGRSDDPKQIARLGLNL
jgi:MraZ protein